MVAFRKVAIMSDDLLPIVIGCFVVAVLMGIVVALVEGRAKARRRRDILNLKE